MDNGNPKCPKCRRDFSSKIIPLELPCFHSFCRNCLDQIVNENNRLYCIVDDKTYDLKIEKLPLSHFYLDYLNVSTNVQITCKDHNHKFIEYVCYIHDQFLCGKCLLSHIDHKEQLHDYDEKKLSSDIKILNEKLEEAKLHAEKIKKKIEELQLMGSVSAPEIKKVFEEGVSYLTHPFCEKLENEEKLSVFPLSLGKSDNRLFPNSLVLSEKCPNIGFLNELFLPSIKPGKLLYRGSENNFKAATFHQMCDNISPTIVLIKTKNERFFGAYCTSSWNSAGAYIPGDGNFLFSLDNKTKLGIYKSKTHAMYGNSSYGPTFGGNHDLYICDNCFNANSSSSNIGYSYKLPEGANATNHLAGSQNFYVQEYEVYSINYDVLSYFSDSLVLKNCANSNYLNEILAFQFKSVKRIFRASEYGFKSAEFHNKCDNQGPTLVLIKTKNNRYFGAYCAVSWNSGGNYFAAEGNFLFSFDNKTKHDSYQNPGNAMYGNSSYGPTFGGNHDLYVCDNCYNASSSYSNIGHTYKLPQGANAQSHFAGAYNFYVEEYEVYTLAF